MKKIILVALLSYSSHSLEPLMIFWSLDKANLYFEDWNKKGHSKESRNILLNRIPIRLGTVKAPYDVSLKNIGGADPVKMIPLFQAVVTLQYKENSSKKNDRQVIWIGKNCELEVFQSRPDKQDSLIHWIKESVPNKIKEKIFTSKACMDILSKFRN